MTLAPWQEQALAYLGCAVRRPDVATLNRLIAAYVRRVPWESAFRIAKRARTTTLADAPRWPEEFWADASERGGGGTCFESNYAFFDLLQALGYEGYLTINDMGDTCGCHTAIVLRFADHWRLVDVGIPLHCSIRFALDKISRAAGPFHTYFIRPDGADSYQIERTRHPQRNIFTLRNQPVEDAVYRAALTNDYGPNGLFLNRVVINKLIDEQIYRFSSTAEKLCVEQFDRQGNKVELPLTEHALAAELGQIFGMDEDILAEALAAVAPQTT
jgi:arylamine N-acetyltransferase